MTEPLASARLRLRRLTEADAPFVLDLVNQPAWLRFIGDRGVRTLDDARAYILAGPLASYARHGSGLLVVETRADGAAIGLCGLVWRDWLPAPDLGFALLPRWWRQGYAHEAAAATLAHAHGDLGLGRVLAVTSPDNDASIALLGRLGFGFVRALRDPAGDDVKLFARALP